MNQYEPNPKKPFLPPSDQLSEFRTSRPSSLFDQYLHSITIRNARPELIAAAGNFLGYRLGSTLPEIIVETLLSKGTPDAQRMAYEYRAKSEDPIHLWYQRDIRLERGELVHQNAEFWIREPAIIEELWIGDLGKKSGEPRRSLNVPRRRLTIALPPEEFLPTITITVGDSDFGWSNALELCDALGLGRLTDAANRTPREFSRRIEKSGVVLTDLIGSSITLRTLIEPPRSYEPVELDLGPQINPLSFQYLGADTQARKNFIAMVNDPVYQALARGEVLEALVQFYADHGDIDEAELARAARPFEHKLDLQLSRHIELGDVLPEPNDKKIQPEQDTDAKDEELEEVDDGESPPAEKSIDAPHMESTVRITNVPLFGRSNLELRSQAYRDNADAPILGDHFDRTSPTVGFTLREPGLPHSLGSERERWAFACSVGRAIDCRIRPDKVRHEMRRYAARMPGVQIVDHCSGELLVSAKLG